MNKKANMALLTTFAISFAIAGIYLSMGAKITDCFGKEFYYDTSTLDTRPLTLTSTLTNYWTFDDNLSTINILEYLDITYNGTSFSNTIDLSTTGIIGTALEFDGATENITFGDATLGLYNALGVKNFTVSVWVKILTNDTNVIIGRQENVTDGGWRLLINGSNYPTIIFSNETTNETYSAEQNISYDSWTNIIYSNEMTLGKFYINGVLDASSNNTWTMEGSTNDTTANMQIGNIEDNFFNGSLDDIRLFNSTLSQSVITALYDEAVAADTYTAGVVYTSEYAYNISQKTQEGLGSIANRLPLIGLTIGIILVVGYLKLIQ